jgi:hypothetical protein
VSALTELIARVACTSIKLDALSDHLNDHPDAFVSGDSQCPRVVVQLLVVLADAGVEGIALARCVSCARPRRHLQVVTETGRLCDQCRKRDRAEPCARCTRTAPVARRLTTGEPLCHRCATADPTWWQPCSLCGTRGNVVSRVAGEPIGPCCYVRPVIRCTVCGLAKGVKPWKSRRPLCAACAERPRALCGHCGCDAAIPPVGHEPLCAVCVTTSVEMCEGCGRPTPAKDRGGRALCPDCYRRPARACGRCGRVRTIARLAIGDDPDLCALCWTGPMVICAECGQLRPCRGERRGRMLCSKCAPFTPQRCAHCGRSCRTVAKLHEGPVCSTCYRRVLASKGCCPGCGETRRLMVHPGWESKVCATCSGAPPRSVCTRCGIEDSLYRRGLCSACSLPLILDEVLGDDAARKVNGLGPVFDRLVQLDPSRWLLDWLTRGSAATILARFASGELPLEHEAFDQLPTAQSTWFVERLLVTAGALPDRDPILARMERWTADYLAKITDVDRQRLLSRYATWQLLRPLRAKSAVAPLSDFAHNGRKQRLKGADAFLGWLEADGRTLADCTQAVVERWAATGPPGWSRVRPFIAWAHQQGLVGSLEFPTRPAGVSSSLIGTEERWAIARRLLHEADLDPVIRVAGLLVVLYAQPLARIARLRTDQIHTNDGHTELLIGASPIRIPSPLDEHIGELMQRHVARTVSEMTGDEPWLFPGAMAGRPIHANTLATRLVDAGVPSTAHRQAALAHLAASMPAAIVADLLGVSIRTAIRWAALTGRSWADYTAHR